MKTISAVNTVVSKALEMLVSYGEDDQKAAVVMAFLLGVGYGYVMYLAN